LYVAYDGQVDFFGVRRVDVHGFLATPQKACKEKEALK
jgi:hypothetical protein